jgi:hypothetical protein
MRITMLSLSAVVLMLAASSVSAQETPASPAEVAKVNTAGSTASNNGSTQPVFTDYRGVRIGMSADEVKTKLKNLKDGGTGQDFFVFSERESAQIYYDENKKVMAISIDYIGDSTNAPSPSAVLGIELEAKPDGSMYQLNRYPEAGYWVSYNRTAGDKPIVTITMQKFGR